MEECEYIAGMADKDCIPCRGGVPPLPPGVVEDMLQKLGRDWTLVDSHHLSKGYTFPDFKSALAFVNQVGAIAEQENHHPEIQCGWGHVTVQIWTHKIDGLTESDFILAAKCDEGVAP